jgi:hypothetical protein
VLNEFTNINKHRRVLLASHRSYPLPMAYEIESRGGNPFVKLPYTPVGDGRLSPFPRIEEQSQPGDPSVTFVAFDESPAKDMEVCSVLIDIGRYVELVVVPGFEQFFA